MHRLVIIVAVSLACLGDPAYGGQDSAKALYGVWRLLAFQTLIIGEAAPREPFGPHPFGYLILTPQHRMMAYVSKTDRRPPTDDAEAAALLRSMIAYTGKFRLEGDKFITAFDGAWNEILKAHEQARYFSIEDDRLTIRTAEQPTGNYPGKRVVSTTTWERKQ